MPMVSSKIELNWTHHDAHLYAWHLEHGMSTGVVINGAFDVDLQNFRVPTLIKAGRFKCAKGLFTEKCIAL